MSINQKKSGQNRLLALAVLVAACLFARTTAATTFTCAADGSWTTPATWGLVSGGVGVGYPGASDIATIAVAHTVTVSDAEACTTLNVTTSGSAKLQVQTGGTVTVSGTTTVNNSANITVDSNGTLNLATATITSGTVNNNGTMTVTGNLTGLGSLVQGANALLTLGGTSTLTTQTFSGAGNTVNYSGAGQTCKSGNAYVNLTLSGSGTKTISGITISGTITMDGSCTATLPASLTIGAINLLTTYSGTLTGGATESVTGNVTVTGGTLKVASSATALTVNGTTTVNGGIITCQSATTATFSGNFTLSSGTFTASSGVLSFGANFSFNGGTLTTGSGAFTFTNATPAIGGTSVAAMNNVAFGDGTHGCNPSSSGSGFTISGTLTIAAGNTTYDNTGTLGVGNLIVNGTCANDGTLTVTTLTTMNAGGTLNNNSIHTFTGNTGTFTGGAINNNGTMSFSGAISGTGTTVTQGANASLTFGNTLTAFTLVASASGNTVNYSRASTQTILGATYYNLTTSGGAGTKTLGGNTVVNGTLTVGAGTTLAASTLTLSVAGNVVNNGTLSVASTTVTFNGSTNQTVTGNAVTFNNVIVNNTGSTSNNTVTVYGGAVNGSTTITAGHFVLVGPVAELIWSTPPPASVSPNTIISNPYPVIQTADANGNPSTVGLAASQMIIVSLSGSGTLSGTTNFDIGTASTNGSTGTVICSNLSVTGSGAITLIAAPGTGLNPATIPGICLWLDGSDSNSSSMTFSGTTITTWRDKSGNGHDFNTTFSTSPPGPIALTAGTTNVNGRTGVMFPGDGGANGSSLLCTNLNINNNALSIYVMTKQLISLPASWRLSGFAANTSANDYDSTGLYLYGNTSLLVARANTQLGGGATKPALGTPWLGEVIFNNSTAVTAILQKGAAASSSSAGSSGSFSLTGTTIAGGLSSGYSPDSYWSGPVYEYIIFTNALSAPNQAAVESYLTNKWIPSITNNATASLSLIVPTASAGSPQTICNGGSVQIGGSPTASGGSGSGYTYSWSPSNGLSSVTVSNPIASPTTTTTYSVAVTDGLGGVSTPATVVVTVNPLPTITLGANPTVDAGSTNANLPYTATSNSPNQYEIMYDAAAHTAGFTDVSSWTTLPATPIALVVPGGASIGTYYGTNYVQNSVTGCVSVAYPFSVTLAPPYSAYQIMAASSTPTAGVGDVLTITAVNSDGSTNTSLTASVSLTFSGMTVIGANQPTYNGTPQTSPITLSFSGGQASVTLVAYSANGGSAQTPHVTDGSHTDTNTSGSSLALTVAPAAASQLAFTSSPVTATAGTASGSISVQRLDPYGNPNTTDAAISVALSSSSTGMVVFNPASPLNIAQGSSSASFTYSDTKAGSQTITATNSGWPSVTQTETINAGSASQLIVTLPGQTFTPFSGNSGTASAQTATTPFNITLTAVDAYTNIDTSYTGAQTVSYSGPTGSGNTYTTSVTFSSGQASGLATMINSAQTCAITPSISGGPTGLASSSFTVGPDAISINFGSDVQAMNAGDTAGVIPLAHWNNASGASVTVNNLQNLGGTASSASVTVSCPGTWHAGNGTADGNHKMLTGYVDQQGTITVSGLPSAITDSYSVYVYVGADGNGRQGSVNIGGTTCYFSTAAFSFDNGGGGAIAPDTFVQATSTNSGTYTPGNYVLFTGLSGSSFTITWAHVSINCGVFGLQIVATPRTPSAMAVSSAANPSGYGQSVTFTATVTANVTATGNVIFKADGAPFGTNTLNGSDIATVTTSALTRGTRTITAEYAGDANVFGSTNNLAGGQGVTNHPPVAVTDVYTRGSGISMKITIANLLTNDTDVDTDTIQFVTASATTTNNATVTNDGTYLYVPASTVNDAFTYTIQDGNGGTNTGNVYLSLVTSTGQVTTVSPTPSNATAVFFGIPDISYTVQRATNVTFDGGVSNFPPMTAPSNGVFSVTDDFGDLGSVPGSAFYRLLIP